RPGGTAGGGPCRMQYAAGVPVRHSPMTPKREPRAKPPQSEPRAPVAVVGDAHAHVGTFHWKVDGDVMQWSDAMCAPAGRAASGEKRALDDMLNAIHPEDRERARQSIRDALRDKEPFRLRLRLVTPDRREVTVECVGSVDVDDHGRATGVHG